MTKLRDMTGEEVLKHFDWYDFRDVHGHPLTHIIDFLALVRLARPVKPVIPPLPEPMVRRLLRNK